MSVNDIKKIVANIENDVKSPKLYNLEIFTPKQKMLFDEYCSALCQKYDWNQHKMTKKKEMRNQI